MASFKIVVVGDGSVGKTCLLMSYAFNTFPNEYTPTVFDNYDADVMVNGVRYKLHLHDTAGQSDYDQMRPLSYAKSDAFLLCFSLTNKTSLQNIQDKWYPEVQKHGPDVPIILVGTKSDLRDNNAAPAEYKGGPKPSMLPTSAGESMAGRIHAVTYLECSALTQAGLKHVFDSCITAIINRPKPTAACGPQCIIL